jgi:ABC-type bacteriocin/lantibiotic exporter with double-glycine peptidase domain
VLARAILKDPRILILDEATSNLDPESEGLVINALKKICVNRTCLIVTHKIEGYKELITRTVDLKNNRKD